MPAAASLPDEILRATAVRRTALYGTPAEERFDRITRLARRILDVPIALITLVGSDTVWVKSVQGLEAVDGCRADSYCQHTVADDDICVIEDARMDPRVWDSPSAASIVFYAGVPLKFDGRNVAALCIADHHPRTLGADDLRALRDLADLAEQEFQVVALSGAQLELAAAHRELEARASIDGLTRMWNRGAIEAIGARELARQRIRELRLGLAVVDIDHFKKVNDTYGHAAGDEVLRVVAGRLRGALRTTDAVGRYGGEEFLAVIPGVDELSLFQVCERIRHALSAEPITFEGGSIDVRCSIGCALANRDEDAIDGAVRRADQALYAAKRGGRDRVVLAEPRQHVA